MAVTAASSTARIRAVPDIEAPPPEALVLLSDAGSLPNGGKVEWTRLKASKRFKFVRFEEKPNPPEKGPVFKNISVLNYKVECDFEPPDLDPSGTEYPYRLTIRYPRYGFWIFSWYGPEYNTDLRAPGPIHGRAVIRN